MSVRSLLAKLKNLESRSRTPKGILKAPKSRRGGRAHSRQELYGYGMLDGGDVLGRYESLSDGYGLSGGRTRTRNQIYTDANYMGGRRRSTSRVRRVTRSGGALRHSEPKYYPAYATRQSYPPGSTIDRLGRVARIGNGVSAGLYRGNYPRVNRIGGRSVGGRPVGGRPVGGRGRRYGGASRPLTDWVKFALKVYNANPRLSYAESLKKASKLWHRG